MRDAASSEGIGSSISASGAESLGTRSKETTWHLSRLLSPAHADTSSNIPLLPKIPYAVVILNQPVNKPALSAVLEHAALVVCADAGGDRYLDYTLGVQQRRDQHVTKPTNNSGDHMLHGYDPSDGHVRSEAPNKKPREEQDDDVASSRPVLQPSSPNVPDSHIDRHRQTDGIDAAPSPGPKNTVRAPDAIVGDLDSISARALQYWKARGVEIVHDPDQYSTDFSKTLRWLRRKRSSTSAATATPDDVPLDVLVLGGLGGRVDQGFSQIHHLVLAKRDPTILNGRLYLLSEQSLSFVLDQGRNVIWVDDWCMTTDLGEQDETAVADSGAENGQEKNDEGLAGNVDRRPQCSFNESVGIIPITGPATISLQGFEWDVTDWQTEFGGQLSTSNHIRNKRLVIDVEGNSTCLFTMELADHLQLGNG